MDEQQIWQAFFKVTAEKIWGSITTLFRRKRTLSIAEVKRLTRVLFVDDEPNDSLAQDIRQAGWNVTQVTDVTNLDAEEIRSADIVFMDYKGVGTRLSPTEEGIGLLKALRSKYPGKWLIFYSGYAGIIPGHEIHEIANAWIQKNADPWVYIQRIENAATSIHAAR